MSNANTRPAIPDGWLESLQRSKTQIAGGETVPLLPLLDRLRSAAEQLETDLNEPLDNADLRHRE